MKQKVINILICGVIVFGITGCFKEEKVSITELNDVNDKIIEYFQTNDMREYPNYSYNYVDEENKVVIVGLVENSEKEQEWFKKNIVDSKYIKFEQGNHATDDNQKNYENVDTLYSDKVDTKTLVKFNGALYGKSHAILDYVGGVEAIGTIDKLIADIYIPKLDGETNTANILNALVFFSSDNSIVLLYDNEYVLFEKIAEE